MVHNDQDPSGNSPYGAPAVKRRLTDRIGDAISHAVGQGRKMVADKLRLIHDSAMAGHLFLLYFAVMSAMTPPVAVAAYAASAIAEDNPLTIALIAVRLSLAAYIVPFVFVYGQELLMTGPALDIVWRVAASGVGLVVLSAALEGYARSPLYWWERLLACAGAIALLHPSWQGDAAGALLASAALARSFAAGWGGAKSAAPGGKGN